MIASVSLRFREQDLITLVMSEFLDSGWSYQGYIPGPEYTIKAQNSSFAVGNQAFQIGSIEKDRWFLLTFVSQTATEIPAGLNEIQIGGKKDAFFKANRPAFLSGRITTFPKRNDSLEPSEEMPDAPRSKDHKPAVNDMDPGTNIFLGIGIVCLIAAVMFVLINTR